jgi:AraC family transcriptional regulator
MLPSRLQRTSADLGWSSLIVRTYADPPEAEPFTVESPWLTVVLVTEGRYRIESRHGGSWRPGAFRPGSLSVSAPGRPSELRWHSSDGRPMESLHLHLDPGPAGDVTFPDTLVLRDDFVASATRTLGRALRAGAPALYAESVGQAIVTHLAYRGPARPAAAGRDRALGAGQVRRVTDYMRAHLHEDVSAGELAALVNLSKYHFIRAFAQTVGLTPHRYLRRERMRAAAEQLRTTDLSVARIAAMHGYRSPGRFAAAFRQEQGVRPGDLRR